jgi:putative transposase
VKNTQKNLRVDGRSNDGDAPLAIRVLAYAHKHDVVAYEDLQVRNMVKNHSLAKSINDSGWYQFRKWIEYFGVKFGKITIAVPPQYTSINCSNCGEKVAKTLSTRTHICPHCGYTDCRDRNAAINILKKGLSTSGHYGTWILDIRNASGEETSTLAGESLRLASFLCE